MTKTEDVPLFPAPEHNHQDCVATIVSRAKKLCSAKGIKLTKLRESVLQVVAANHCAVGAYEIIETLAKDGKRIAPISVYRILEALIEAGLIHRLESRNAYFICHSTHAHDRRSIFLVCDHCGVVAEVEAQNIGQAIETVADNANFKAYDAVVEIGGICQHCAETSGASELQLEPPDTLDS